MHASDGFPDKALERLRMSDVYKPGEPEVVALRAALNSWAGPAQRLDAEGKRLELAEREEMMAALLRLRAISDMRSNGARRPVRGIEVERVLSCFRRLALMSGATPAEIAEYCEKAAEDDDHVMAFRGDPWLLRYVLTFHREETRMWFAKHDLTRLRYVCDRADLAGIRAWFERVCADTEALPKDCCQFLRLQLLTLWNCRMGDMETLAFEQAVLEVRMFATMGWENTRMFCALLRRIGGGNLPAFGAYLNSEDIAEASALHEALGDAEQCGHFRALATVHEPGLVAELERMVFATAAHIDDARRVAKEPPVVVEPAPTEEAPLKPVSRLRRLWGAKN
jgi:hypothetical protein